MESRSDTNVVRISHERRRDAQGILAALLKDSINGVTPTEMLGRSLDLVLGLDWLADAKGCVFLVDPDRSDTLVMVGNRGLPETCLRQCAELPIGRCLCGMAAKTGEIQYAAVVDERHEVETGEPEHGHYVIPVMAHEDCVGVINVYLRPGHVPTEGETALLQSVADTSSGLIQRERVRTHLADRERQLAGIVDAFDGLMYMSSQEFIVEYMNERFQKLCGCDTVGKVCYEAIHKLEDPCPWCTNDQVFKGETVRFEVQLPLDGRYYMVVNRPIIHSNGRMSKISMSIDITERRLAEVKLENLVEDLESVLKGVVLALAYATSERDPYTAVHQERVARLCGRIAEAMGKDTEFIRGLQTAAVLHDIGKISVPSEILSKPGKLSDDEMGIIKAHSSVGYRLLEPVPFRHPVARAVLEHHERMDGSGYPSGLRGDELLLESRIIAVADVVEAMMSHRPYRPAMGLEAALDEITQNAGAKYDPDVARACIQVLRNPAEPAG